MDILRPGYDRVKDEPDHHKQLRMLEKEAVLISLENLMSFPFVREAVENDMHWPCTACGPKSARASLSILILKQACLCRFSAHEYW